MPEPSVSVINTADQNKSDKIIEKIQKFLNQEWEQILRNNSVPLPAVKDAALSLHQDSEKLLSQLGDNLQRLDVADFNRTLYEKNFKDLIMLYFNLTEFDPKTNTQTKKHYTEPVLLTRTQFVNLYTIVKARIDGIIKEFHSDEKKAYDLAVINNNLKILYPSEDYNLNSIIKMNDSDRLKYYDVWTSVYHILVKHVFPRYKASSLQTSGVQAAVLMTSWYSYDKDQEMIKLERKQAEDTISMLFEANNRIVLRQEIIEYCEHFINQHGLSELEEIIKQITKSGEIENYLNQTDKIDDDDFFKIILRFRPGLDEEYYIKNSSILSIFTGQLNSARSRDRNNPGLYLKFLIYPLKDRLFTNIYSGGPDTGLNQTSILLKDNRRFIEYIKKIIPDSYPILYDIYRFFEKYPVWLKKICVRQKLNINEFFKNDGSIISLLSLLGLSRSEVINELYNGRGFYFLLKLLDSWLHNLFKKGAPRNILDIIVEEKKNIINHKKISKNSDTNNKNYGEAENDNQISVKKPKEGDREGFIKNYRQVCEKYFKGKKESDYANLQRDCLEEWNIRPAIKDPKERKDQEIKDKIEIDNQIKRYLPILRNDISDETIYDVIEDIMGHPPASNVVRQKELRQYIILSILLQIKPG